MDWFHSQKEEESSNDFQTIKEDEKSTDTTTKKNKEVRMSKKEDKNDSNGDVIAFLGQGTEFKGMITYDGTIRVDGRIEGEIITKGTLVIGQNADIEAQINAGTVVCAGRVSGNITATEKVQLQAPAILNGSIKTPIVIIEEGVTFNGNCEMEKTEPASGNETIHTQSTSVYTSITSDSDDAEEETEEQASSVSKESAW